MTDSSPPNLKRCSSSPQDRASPEKQNYAKIFVNPGEEDHNEGGDDFIVINGVEMLAKKRRQRRQSRLSISAAPPHSAETGTATDEGQLHSASELSQNTDSLHSGSHGLYYSPTEEAVSTDRLRQLIMGDLMGDAHGALFCELQQLHDGEWHEKARWVRFEEDVEEGGGRWSKPFVATLPLHALFELRQSLAQGVILLDISPKSYGDLVDQITDALVAADHLDETQRVEFLATLHYRHVHQHEQSQPSLRRGLSEIGRKLSSHDTPSLMTNQLASGGGGSAAIVGGIAGMSTLPVPSAASQSQLSREEKPAHKSNEHFARKLALGTEASAAMAGGVEFLGHTVAAFVRLSNERLVLGKLTEVSVPCRFVFVLLGPTHRAKDVHEIGRAMSTIMSDDIFRDVAYRASDRADILAGLDEFLDEVTVLPPGEWDPTIRIQPPKTVPTQEERKQNALNQIAEEGAHQGSNLELQRTHSSSTHDGLVMKTPSLTVCEHKELLEAKKEKSPRPSPRPSPKPSPAGSTVGLDKKPSDGDEEHPDGKHPEGGGGHRPDPELLRTGRIFGGLVRDVKRKVPWLVSDVTDALNPQCAASVVYLFFACLAPIVTFGGLLGIATDNNIAAFETILSGAICGTTFHLFSGQPITIIGSTGPVLIFEKIVFYICDSQGFNYLSLRFWIGIWTSVVLMLVVAFDMSALVQLITRFTEECFATLISVIFIFESFLAIFKLYQNYPISTEENLAQNYSCSCGLNNQNFTLLNESAPPSYYCQSLDLTNCSQFKHCEAMGPGCGLHEPVPDVFFFSCLIFFGTCFLSFALKNFRMTPFFPNKVRCILSDFAVSISIFVMIGIDVLVGLPTPKLVVPENFAPTRPDRGWLIEPFENPIWTIFAAPIPAILLSVLLFLDQQITAVIVNRREHKLKKGKGYHLDLFVLTIHVMICATFGLPYFVAATVLSITHVNSLRKQSETAAPGEQPKFLGLIEQRVTGFVVFALIGCAIPLRSILKYIPMPVLYGVFLYMGLAALQTSQFYDRVLLFFMPVKYQPDAPYLRHMKTWRVHMFTGIQLAAFLGLWLIKQFKTISLLFILMLVVMVIVRRLLDFVFTQDELRWVDDILPKNPLAVPKNNADSGSKVHLPQSPNTSSNVLRQRGSKCTDAEAQPLNSSTDAKNA